MWRALSVVLLAGGLCLGVAVWWPAEQNLVPSVTPANTVTTHQVTMPATGQSQTWLAPVDRPLAKPGPLPASLQGASHGVALRSDAEGNLLVQDDILRLFEFYLAAIEEESIEALLQRIQWELASQLQDPARQQANDLLRRYLDYRLALMALPQPTTLDSHTLAAHLQQVDALRQQHFSSVEQTALFAAERAEDAHLLATLQNNESPGSAAEPGEMLSVEQRLQRQQASRDAEVFEQVEQLRASGASAGQIYAVREQQLGSEAATALAQLDEQQALWQQRLQVFAAERQRIHELSLPAEEQRQAISTVLASSFDEREQLRVRALHEEW